MIKEFSRPNLKDPENSILYDFEADSDVLAICFSGINVSLESPPPFEFSGVLRSFDVRKIFVRDCENYSYHNGLKNLTSNISDSINVIKKLIDESGCSRVIAIGNCQGGYSAIFFGSMLSLDLIVSFSPITYLDKENRRKYNEQRWVEGFERIYSGPSTSPQYYDLSTINETNEVPITIYCDLSFGPDRNFTEHFMKGKSNVTLIERNGHEHFMVRELRRTGEFEEIFTNAFFQEA